ncbi:acyltransferase [Rhodococcus sp. IEGM 1305]|uniref:acyltransferase n=1 Tax=Rhodococcus sp. IEGM 1305 TaxID=3047092 RepID=UPI0024B7834F|nr:acyltransferase [Rhodococcus sp. IEGM 1305]MDI9948782.1 acyltransferase [Rhodococcus sp. IEGM 1305]
MKLDRIKFRALKSLKGPVVAARAAGCTVGQGCRLYSDISTNEPWLVSIGDRVTISSGVNFVTHDGSGWLHRDEKGRRYRIAPIEIGSDVFVGLGATIMPGVKIGDRCVVGSGSVVTKSIPSGHVVAGNPARIVTTWKDFIARVDKWPTESDMVGDNRRDQVDSITEKEFRPFMSTDAVQD